MQSLVSGLGGLVGSVGVGVRQRRVVPLLGLFTLVVIMLLALVCVVAVFVDVAHGAVGCCIKL